jgi:hypothetical protein
MIVILPASLLAQDANRGLLHSDGGTWLNEVPATPVAAIFPDSLVETQAGHVARIDVEGSSVLIAPETMVQFQGHELVLDHGSLQLDTSREMEVMVGCITVSPISSARTEYEVTDGGGKVRVLATKSDVKIHAHENLAHKPKPGESSDKIVHEGEHYERSEHCVAAAEPQQAATPGTGAALNSSWAWWGGIAIAGVLICLGLCHGDDPISPHKP